MRVELMSLSPRIDRRRTLLIVAKKSVVQPRRLAITALAILAIGSAAWSRPGASHPHADPSVALNTRTAVPAPVMSVLPRACFDCHSDNTRWPWYAQLPIASHLIARDVKDGRGQVNWSRWEEYNRFDRAGMLDKMCELASTGQMPPWQYRILHWEAQVSDTDLSALCAWTRDESTRLTGGGS